MATTRFKSRRKTQHGNEFQMNSQCRRLAGVGPVPLPVLGLIILASIFCIPSPSAVAFVPSSPSTSTSSSSSLSPIGRRRFSRSSPSGASVSIEKLHLQQQRPRPTNRIPSTRLHFMGSDGGIFGIGTPEAFTILLVGYFVLGPSDLYKLVKEIGKFVQNFQTFSAEATANLENSFESQLQLEEIRKAQRELNDAFSFRRSINVDSTTDPFEVDSKSPRLPEETGTTPTTLAATAAASSTTLTTGNEVDGVPSSTPKKKIRRRVRKKKKEQLAVEDDMVPEPFPDMAATTTTTELQELANNVPDLDLNDEDDLELAQMQQRAEESMRLAQEELRKEREEEEERTRIRAERLERLEGSKPQQEETSSTDSVNGSVEKDPQVAMAEQSRFQQQLSRNWNNQILENDDKLGPLANIMDRLAILEDEKAAADRRLQEEFKLREENEERYYREKRALLEEAAAKVQADAYNLTTEMTSDDAATTVTGSNS